MGIIVAPSKNLLPKTNSKKIQLNCDNFICQECGKCCVSKEHGAMINESDIGRISKKLGLLEKEFIEKYIHKSKLGYELRRNDDECIFLYNKKCKIHLFKPEVCEKFPRIPEFCQKENYKYFKNICLGLKQVSYQEQLFDGLLRSS